MWDKRTLLPDERIARVIYNTHELPSRQGRFWHKLGLEQDAARFGGGLELTLQLGDAHTSAAPDTKSDAGDDHDLPPPSAGVAEPVATLPSHGAEASPADSPANSNAASAPPADGGAEAAPAGGAPEPSESPAPAAGADDQALLASAPGGASYS